MLLKDVKINWFNLHKPTLKKNPKTGESFGMHYQASITLTKEQYDELASKIERKDYLLVNSDKGYKLYIQKQAKDSNKLVTKKLKPNTEDEQLILSRAGMKFTVSKDKKNLEILDESWKPCCGIYDGEFDREDSRRNLIPINKLEIEFSSAKEVIADVDINPSNYDSQKTGERRSTVFVNRVIIKKINDLSSGSDNPYDLHEDSSSEIPF